MKIHSACIMSKFVEVVGQCCLSPLKKPDTVLVDWLSGRASSCFSFIQNVPAHRNRYPVYPFRQTDVMFRNYIVMDVCVASLIMVDGHHIRFALVVLKKIPSTLYLAYLLLYVWSLKHFLGSVVLLLCIREVHLPLYEGKMWTWYW